MKSFFECLRERNELRDLTQVLYQTLYEIADERDAAVAVRDELGALVGMGIVWAALAYGERPAAEPNHALTAGILALIEQRDAAVEAQKRAGAAHAELKSEYDRAIVAWDDQRQKLEKLRAENAELRHVCNEQSAKLATPAQNKNEQGSDVLTGAMLRAGQREAMRVHALAWVKIDAVTSVCICSRCGEPEYSTKPCGEQISYAETIRAAYRAAGQAPPNLSPESAEGHLEP